MMNELIGNYLNVIGFKVFIVVLFLAAVVELLVRANYRMKRKVSPFKAPRLWVVGMVVMATVFVHFRNGNFARLLTVVSFILVSLAFELSPAINKIKVLRLYFANWSLKKSLLKA